MARLLILGATGSLGRHVLSQAITAGHEISVLVRDSTRLPPTVGDRILVHTGDLREPVPPGLISGQDALINCAGHVAQGQEFVDLVGRVIASVEALPTAERPVCWFLAGAALLDLDASGRRAVDLPDVSSTYWPHRVNFERPRRSPLDWRLLCPGPLVEQPAHGLDSLRVTLDRVPLELRAGSRAAARPEVLPVLASLIPLLRLPYADAAGLMLAHLERGSAMAGRRVGLARRTDAKPHSAVVA